MIKYTLNVPDDLMESLRDEHARTFSEHRRAFGPWLCSVWAAWLATQRDPARAHGNGTPDS